jgi:transposase, IS5 family
MAGVCQTPAPGRCHAGQGLASQGISDPAAGRPRGALRRATHDLTGLLRCTQKIVAQTRQRLSGLTPDGASRQVSLHDRDARPIAKGRLGRPVEFGCKAQVNLERSETGHSCP